MDHAGAVPGPCAEASPSGFECVGRVSATRLRLWGRGGTSLGARGSGPRTTPAHPCRPTARGVAAHPCTITEPPVGVTCLVRQGGVCDCGRVGSVERGRWKRIDWEFQSHVRRMGCT